jgi:hypothetical protein
MTTTADTLWRLNNEYNKRLQQAQRYLSLLEQLMLLQAENHQALADLRRAADQVETLMAEHRAWRHQFYYESLDTRRMVQGGHAVNHALAQFARMRHRHHRILQELNALLYQMQRPDPTLTRVPTGDLWAMTHYAIQDLSGFDDFTRSLTQV